MKRNWNSIACAGALIVCGVAGVSAQLSVPLSTRNAEERLNTQTHDAWSPRLNINTDTVIVYSVSPGIEADFSSWRQHGYKVETMTGIAWGDYSDYLNGKFDGKNHWDQGQRNVRGEMILHGGSVILHPKGTESPYMSPSEEFGKYLTVGIKRVLDAGTDAIFLEEPEYFAWTGWEKNLRREWKSYYHDDWQPPNQSPDAQYRAAKLKYYLYRRTLGQVCDFVWEYDKEHGRNVPCYIATHSLINYAKWSVISPESSLMQIRPDGYIAQIWTGTARSPNYYDGVKAERTFDSAYLEYATMANMLRVTGKPLWFIYDPVEDNPNHDWNDYRRNSESTLTAALMQPGVWRYEVVPWPERVFNGNKYPAKSIPEVVPATDTDWRDLTVAHNKPDQKRAPAQANNVEKVVIPKSYETEIQTVINAMGDMKQPDVHWLVAGTRGAGILVSDTMMFERAAPDMSDFNLGSFFGLALPLVKHGIPLQPAQIENSTIPGYLDRYKLLVLTYEGQKPPTPEFHEALAKWVRNGGALLVVDNDDDAYNSVREWWNTAPLEYKTPREHLFRALGIPQDAEGLFHVGRGAVLSARLSPAALSHQKNGSQVVLKLAHQLADAVHLPWRETNALVLHRGPYIIGAGLDESIPGAKPIVLHGRFVNLFDANLAVQSTVTLTPGKQVFLYDLDSTPRGSVPGIVAAACRVRQAHWDPDSRHLTVQVDGIADSNGVMRIQTSLKPIRVTVAGNALPRKDWKIDKGTLLLRFPNSASPYPIEIAFH